MLVMNEIIYGILALGLWSILYRENMIYRIIEYFWVGFAAANLLVMGWESARKTAVIPLLTKGEIIWIIPLIISLGFILFFFKKTKSLYMISIAMIVAVGSGISIRGVIHAQIVGQLVGSMGNLIGNTVMLTFNNVVIWLGAVCTLSYFVFTKEPKGALTTIPRIGRMFIMVVVGASYANTGLGRLANTTGILVTLWRTDAVYIIPVALIVIAIDILMQRKKETLT